MSRINGKTSIAFLTINDILTILILCYTISTMLQGIIPFSLNRLVVVVIIMCLVIYNIKHLRVKTLLLFFYTMCLTLFNFMFTKDTNQAIHDLIYFFSTVLLINHVSSSNLDKLSNSFEKNGKLIKLVTFLLFFITVISLLVKSNYDIVWGDGVYFMGFPRDTHVMASSSCLLMALLFYEFYEKKFSYLNLSMLVLMLFIIFQTGARTYIVPASLMCYLYIKGKINNRYIKFFIVVLAFVGITVIFMKSGMYQKFMWSSNADNQFVSNSLTSLTGGRSEFWIIDLKAFFESNFFYMLFGHGFDYVFDVNEMQYGIRIWAHNDLINLLLSVGVFGTVYYLRCWTKFFDFVAVKREKMYLVVLVIYVLFPMIFNGMYTTQHYLFSVLILFVTIRKKLSTGILI